MLFLWIRIKNASTLAFWLAALMVPAMIWFMAVLFSDNHVSIQVGIYGDMQIESESWTLINYTDREQLRQDVANMRLELGYAFDEDGITLYSRETSVADRVTNLMVAAAHLETIAGEVGARSLPMDADAAAIQTRAEGYLSDGALMDRIVIVHGDGVVEEQVTFRRLFHGLLALFAQLFAMLCALGFANQNEREVLKRLKLAGKGAKVTYLLSGFGAVFVMSGVILAITIAVVTFLSPGVWLAADTSVALIYLAAISGLAFLMAMILSEGLYPPLIIVGFIFTVLMGGVIFDLREVLEVVGFLRFLFPSHFYMQTI